MNAHSIRHPWFSPTIPKRKHERELDAESEWPSAYRALSGPDLAPRPAKRLKALEGGLAGLTLHTDPAYLQSNSHSTVLPTPAIEIQVEKTNQIHDAPLDGDAEPYLASIYEWASPHTGASSVMSLPLQGVVSEVNTSDEDEAPMDEDQKRMGDGVFVEGQGVPDYTFYEPEPNTKKRTWYEPEKDRIVVLDLDSSEDESVTRSPRRRRSAFSLSSSSGQTTSRPRSQTDAPVPEFIINSTLLSHIPPPGAVSIPREEDPAKAVVLFRPVKWGTGQGDESPTEEAPVIEGVKPMDASQDDDDAMDIDS